jgi:hypothetical protein
MSTTEERARAAMRAIAGTVHDAPPLRLEPAAGELRSPVRAPRRGRGGSGRPRHWWTWAAPLTAAAVVVALAIALVLIKDIPNGGAVPPNPATSTTGPDGAPRYYAAITPFSGSVRFTRGAEKNTVQDGIVVEDSVTGERIAKFAPPAHTTFQRVMAAADDRTFVVLAVTSSTGSFAPFDKKATMTASWYEVKLAPGTAQPARITALPIKPWSWAPEHSVSDFSVPSPGEVFATALSQDGQELAVADIPPLPAGDLDTAQNWQEVKVFSVATGQLLHDWTEHDPSAAFGDTDWYVPSLTWIDGDRALALVTAHTALPAGTQTGTVRRVDVTGPANGDLMADSTVIWSGALTPNSGYGCYATDSWPPLISADGKTVNCANYAELKTGPSRWMASFDSDPLPPGTAAGFKPRFDYKVTSPLDQKGKPLAGGADMTLLWASPSGDTFIGVWHYIASRPPATGVHFGVIRGGKFTPLRLPSSLANAQPGQIAW